jgi:hypothetical protein
MSACSPLSSLLSALPASMDDGGTDAFLNDKKIILPASLRYRFLSETRVAVCLILSPAFVLWAARLGNLPGNDLRCETCAKNAPSHEMSRNRGAANGPRPVTLLIGNGLEGRRGFRFHRKANETTRLRGSAAAERRALGRRHPCGPASVSFRRFLPPGRTVARIHGEKDQRSPERVFRPTVGVASSTDRVFPDPARVDRFPAGES